MLSSEEPTTNRASSNVRLYVLPLTPELISKIIPSTCKIDAENISCHKLQNCPDLVYGFLDLPQMEAEKLKKKMNGSILKGQKIRIEEARPRKSLAIGETEDTEYHGNHVDEASKAQPTLKNGTEHKGRQLSPDRRIKRGWTEPQNSRKKRKRSEGSKESATSKYSEHEECLFRTKVPPNRAENGVHSTRRSHHERSTRDDHETIVHEFRKSSSHPSFLRNASTENQPKLTASFVEGKGWVNEAGEVIESTPVSHTRMPDRGDVTKDSQSESNSIDGDITSSESDNNIEDQRVGAERDAPALNDEKQSSPSNGVQDGDAQDDDGTSSSGSSAISEIHSAAANPDSPPPPFVSRDPGPAKLHPLEAIFKQPKRGGSRSANKPNLGISTSFNFFDNEAGSETETVMPATPFTRDLQTRTLRSAAPTPDTAAPTKTTFFQHGQAPRSHPATLPRNSNQELSDTPEEAGSAATGTPQGKREPSNFSQWFWANRGDNNRAWRKLRRDAAKEKRQKENKEQGQRFGKV